MDYKTGQRLINDDKLGIFFYSCKWHKKFFKWKPLTCTCIPKPHVMCVCLHIMVSNTYSVVLLFCLSSSCVPYVVSFSGLSFFYCPFGIL